MIKKHIDCNQSLGGSCSLKDHRYMTFNKSRDLPMQRIFDNSTVDKCSNMAERSFERFFF